MALDLCLCFMSCCVLCFELPWPLVSLFQQCLLCIPRCSLSPSVCQCLLLCASPPLITSPGLLPPLPPHLFLVFSVCVLRLFPSCLRPFIASVPASVWCSCSSDVLPEFPVFPYLCPVSQWYVLFLDFDSCILHF